MKRTKIQLQLSPKDKGELNYQSAYLEWDYELLMGHSFQGQIDKNAIIQSIRDDIGIPHAYLNEYRVILQENTLLVIP